MRIRAHLFVLILAALLPVLVFATIMTARFWQLQREAFEQRFLERVRALRLAADTEIESTIQTLRALAASTAANEPPFDSLRAQFENFVATDSGWATMGIVDASGKPVMSVFRTGSANLTLDPATIDEVKKRQQPVISNLVASKSPVAWTTYFAVPVIRRDALRYVLYAGVDHSAWLAFLKTYPIAERAALTLNDREGLIIARTLNDEQWVGKRSTPAFWRRVQERSEDSFRNVGLEGQAFYSAFSRSPFSGWVLGTGVPQDDVEGELRGSLLLTISGIIGTLIVASLLAAVIGRRITREINLLSDSARSMVDTNLPLRHRTLTIAEAATVLDTLEDSARLLHERQKSLNEALVSEAHARAVAEHANEAKDQFLAMLGHELRNPLSAISSASAIQAHTNDPELLGRSREIIDRQVRHLTGIVNGLLDVARIASGKVVLTKAAVDLGDVARYAVHAIQDSGRADQVQIELHLQPAVVWADETRLAQVVTNLVENAVKYTARGGLVEVRVEPEPETVVLSVRDNGSGIAPELLPRIFDMFTQGERTLDRSQGGLGLGLTVVRSLVEQHGGSVRAKSDGPGRGSTFVVRLPRLKDVAPPPKPASPTPAATPRRIVVVDDNPDARIALTEQLRASGHTVETAVDGPTAVETIRSVKPDIAIVDIGLPGFDGLEVARRLRRDPEVDGVTLIALSGYGTPQDRAAALAVGFARYWVKPFEESALSALLAGAPERQR